jgi:hypothetical protein
MTSVTLIRPPHNAKFLMTDNLLPEEEYHSLKQTYAFLCDLIDPKKYPNIPKKIRTNASYCLRHYPRRDDWNKVYDTVGFWNPK